MVEKHSDTENGSFEQATNKKRPTHQTVEEIPDTEFLMHRKCKRTRYVERYGKVDEEGDQEVDICERSQDQSEGDVDVLRGLDQMDINAEFPDFMNHRWSSQADGEPELYSFEDFIPAEPKGDNSVLQSAVADSKSERISSPGSSHDSMGR
ncbi:hypothetical protein ACOMHN_063367 [Nucella lapillus]